MAHADIDIVPIVQRDARKWVNDTHRHLSAPRGDLYRTSLHVCGELRGVGIAGRPCRELQDGRTVEITRIASIALPSVNACTRLYSRLLRAGAALGLPPVHHLHPPERTWDKPKGRRLSGCGTH